MNSGIISWGRSLIILITMMFIVACGDSGQKGNVKEIVVGFGPSTYVDQFEKGIRPLLEAKGYTVKTRVLSQNIQLNPTMKEGALNASVFQSIAYMEDMNKYLNMNMIKLADTASAPQSLRSIRHTSLDEIKDGMVITIPNDPVNAERAARILESLGWIKIKDDAEIATFSSSDIEPDSVNITVREIDPAQSLRTLADVDFAIVNGNYVANAGEKISDGLVVETTPLEHVVMVSIQAKDREAEWAKDLKEAYESESFENYIKSESLYDGFMLPAAWDNR